MDASALLTLEFVGLTTILYFVCNIFSVLYHHVKVYFFPSYPNFSIYGKWSVITGSTDGIGKSVAFQLASRGQNIVLISRNEEKLKTVAKEISLSHNVEVKYLTIDFSDDETIYEKIEKFLKDLDVGILVNNVGMPTPFYPFLKIPNLSQHLQDITRVNYTSVVKMHEVVLPGMVKRKRGLIINVASLACAVPINSVYGSTKAAVDYFSKAMSYEYEDKGITILTCNPSIVVTGMTEKLSSAMSDPTRETADDFAASLLATVGKERETNGCWKHSFVAWCMKRAPVKMIRKEMKRSIPTLRDD